MFSLEFEISVKKCHMSFMRLYSCLIDSPADLDKVEEIRGEIETEENYSLRWPV